MSEFKSVLKTSIIDENPTFVSYLALCPTLGTTTSMASAFGMGLSVLFVLMCSNMAISSIRKYIPDDIRIPVYISIIATIVTVLQLFMHAYLPGLYSNLGIFLDLVVVNCIILGRAEAFASQNTVSKSLLDGFANGLAFTLSLTLLGAFRELLGTGAINFFGLFTLTIFPASIMPHLFVEPVGAFIAFGLLAWVINEIKIKQTQKPKTKEA